MNKVLFRSSVALTAALAFAAASVPAQASAPDQNNYIETMPDGAGGASAPRAREKRYCIVGESTGSRLPVKICKTRKEWKADGVDIPADR